MSHKFVETTFHHVHPYACCFHLHTFQGTKGEKHDDECFISTFSVLLNFQVVEENVKVMRILLVLFYCCHPKHAFLKPQEFIRFFIPFYRILLFVHFLTYLTFTSTNLLYRRGKLFSNDTAIHSYCCFQPVERAVKVLF